MARFDNGFVEPLVAAVGIVILFPAVVGLDDKGTRAVGNIARGPQLMVQGAGHVLQQCCEGHFEGSFRIHSWTVLAPARHDTGSRLA